MNHHPGQVTDYTEVFLVMAYVVLLMTLVAVWGVWGFAAALLLGGALHLILRQAGRRVEAVRTARDARAEAAIRRGRARGR